MASSNRTRTLIAFACCIFFLATTAHLIHTTHIHHEHNKVVAELGFAAASVFSLDILVQAVYIPPVLTAVMLRRLSRESVNFSPENLLESSITRAPPPTI